jgi:hypothetical protein
MTSDARILRELAVDLIRASDLIDTDDPALRDLGQHRVRSILTELQRVDGRLFTGEPAQRDTSTRLRIA